MTLYLYALVDTPVRSPGLETVRVAKTWAVVQKKEAPSPTEKAILAHDRVVRRIARLAPAILPVRFATTVKDRAALVALLLPLADSLAASFARVRDAVQFTLRVSGRKAKPKPVKGGPGTQWLAKRRAREQAPEIDPVTAATRPFTRAARVVRRDEKSELARVYHLVARADVPAWRRALVAGEKELRGVTLTLTGPWPPYAFAELA